MARQTRTAAAIGAAALAVLAVAAGALVAREPRAVASLVAAPAALASPASPEATASPSPAPTAAPTTDPTPRPSPPMPSPSVTPSPRPSSPAPARTSWDLTANGIRFRIAMTPAAAGAPVTWTVRTSSPKATCCTVYLLDFGDDYNATDEVSCSTPDPDVSYTHVYNRAGRKEFVVQAMHADGHSCTGAGTVRVPFEVAPGPSTAQGPAPVVVTFDSSTPVAGGVTLHGEAKDADGYVTRLVVDYGDGSPPRTFPGERDACRATVDGWPRESWVNLPYDPEPPYHRYAEPGTYTLTLTAYSTGCDGTHEQSGSASFTWTVPEP